MSRTPRKELVGSVVREVALAVGIDESSVLTDSRLKDVSHARQMVFALLNELGFTLTEIAVAIYGQPSKRSTVASANLAFQNKYDTERKTRALFQQLAQQLNDKHRDQVARRLPEADLRVAA